MAEYICPETSSPCGDDPANWCDGCECPSALRASGSRPVAAKVAAVAAERARIVAALRTMQSSASAQHRYVAEDAYAAAIAVVQERA